MFSQIQAPVGDRLMALMLAYRADPTPNKVDLGVGVYMDEAGTVPILAAVKQAERHLLATETTKTYIGPQGDPAFGAAMQEMLLGTSSPILRHDRVRTLQTPGGSGALRVAADFLHVHFPGTTVWMSTPSWLNHAPIQRAAHNVVGFYPYCRPEDGTLDFDGMMGTLERNTAPGDVVLLHACCHNPTGVDLSPSHWRELTALMARKALLPLIDCAYQGLDAGVDADVAGLRHMVEALPEALIASSCSKNFGLYRERCGALSLIGESAAVAATGAAALASVVRTNYSMPPAHGAGIVAAIWTDPALRGLWLDELAGMRQRLNSTRATLRARLEQHRIVRDLSFLTDQRGMFSFTGFPAQAIARLRAAHGIYITEDGRINIAGVNPSNIDYLCDSIAAVLAEIPQPQT